MTVVNPNQELKAANPVERSWTIKDMLKWSTDFLTAQGCSNSPRLDVELLLTEVLSCSRINLYTEFDRLLSADEKAQFKELLLRRKNHEPIAYILGEKNFYNLSFKVSPEVLIPRNDTETLVEAAIEFLEESSHEGQQQVLDLGTGSGCIAISVAHKIPASEVTGIDISHQAVAIAQENATNHKINNAKFLHADMLDESFWQNLQHYDLIVSNPPYIAEGEKEALSDSVLQFEPHSALFADDEGLLFYKMLSKKAQSCLAPEGKIIVEVGYLQAAEVVKMLKADGWNDIQVRKDYGGHERVVSAKL